MAVKLPFGMKVLTKGDVLREEERLRKLVWFELVEELTKNVKENDKVFIGCIITEPITLNGNGHMIRNCKIEISRENSHGIYIKDPTVVERT